MVAVYVQLLALGLNCIFYYKRQGYDLETYYLVNYLQERFNLAVIDATELVISMIKV